MRELKTNTYYEYCTPNKDIRYVFKVLEKINEYRYKVFIYVDEGLYKYKTNHRLSSFSFDSRTITYCTKINKEDAMAKII